jgi:hypothetical protein
MRNDFIYDEFGPAAPGDSELPRRWRPFQALKRFLSSLINQVIT